MKKIVLFLLLILSMLCFIGCGEKSEKLKAFDNIFNNIKMETLSTIETNKTTAASNRFRNEIEREIFLKTVEILEESIKQSTYKVDSIEYDEFEANLMITVKYPDYATSMSEIIKKNGGDANEKSLAEITMLKNKDISSKEEKLEVKMIKENDTWIISDRDKSLIIDKMIGL